MKKIITITLLSLLLSSAMAQISSYNSPFGGTYTGDFKKYTPQNQPVIKKQEFKVEVDHIVLLNDNETLTRNINITEMTNYVKVIEKLTIKKLNELTNSNLIALQVTVSDTKHIVSIAMKNDLNEKDNEVMNAFYKEINKIKPFKTKEKIMFHIYFNIDTNLAKNK